MKTFDANYRLLEEMYQDEYYPDFLVDKVKTELQKVIALLEEGRNRHQICTGKAGRKRLCHQCSARRI